MLVKEGFRIPHIDELCKETSEIGSILWLILSCLDDARRRWWCNLIFFTSEDKPTIPDDIRFGRQTTLCIFNLSIWVSIFRRVMLRAGNSEFCQTAFCFFVKLAKHTLGYFFSVMIIVANTKQVFSRQKPTRYANCGAFLSRERSVFFAVFFNFSPTLVLFLLIIFHW